MTTADIVFSPPTWALAESTPGTDSPMRVRRAGSFDDIWKRWLVGIKRRFDEGRWAWPATPTAAEAHVQPRMRRRLETLSEEATFDPELEAYTLALCNLVDLTASSHTDKLALRGQALALWSARTSPATALETLISGLSVDCFGPDDYRTVRVVPREKRWQLYQLPDALRDHLRQHGRAALEPALRAGCDDPVLLAWLLDDEAGAVAEAERRRSSSEPIPGMLIALLPDARDAAYLLPRANAGDGMRAIARHGLALADAVLELERPSREHVLYWSCYPSLAAARKLVDALVYKPTRKLVGQALANMPEHARTALTEAKGRRTKHRDAIDALLATLPAPPSAGSAQDAALVEAPDADLPRVLVSPPWREKKRATLPSFAGLVAHALPYTVDLSSLDPRELARERAAMRTEPIAPQLAAGRHLTEYMLSHASFEDLEALREAGALANVRAEYWVHNSWMSGLTVFLDRDGAKVIPALLQLAPALLPQLACELSFVGAVEVAPLAVSWVRLKSTRKAASDWVRRFPRHAASGLLPIVLGSETERAERERALTLFPLLREHRDAVLAEAAHHGSEVLAAATALLDRDPLEDAPAKTPKVLDGVDGLPRVTLRDGRALSARAQLHLLEMLAFSPIDNPYAGIDQVAAVCDAVSLDLLAQALVGTWVASGMSSAHEWTVRATALIGGDRAARSLFDRGRAWAQDGQKQRSLLVLDVLGTMSSDLALSLVGRMSRSGQRQYLKDGAAAILAELAIVRDLTADELEDRTAPDLGLDEHGQMVLDFGPRRFHVGFDEHLLPFVRDESGERMEQLPRVRKTDDAAKAKQARETWASLRSDAEQVAKDQVARLERMMADERRVAADVFLASFVRHPLIGHLATRLVWGAFDSTGALVATFRVTEDRALASGDDVVYVLPDGATVGLVHPLHLDTATVARWGDMLADYALVQPFGQLSRPQTEFSEEGVLARYVGAQAYSGLLFSLRMGGWRAVHGEYAHITGFTREVSGTHYSLALTPPLTQGASTLHLLRLSSKTEPGARGATRVQRAELCFQLDAVLAR